MTEFKGWDYCYYCGTQLTEQEIKDLSSTLCCDGRDCGCMGLPTEPPYCSKCAAPPSYSQKPEYTEYIDMFSSRQFAKNFILETIIKSSPYKNNYKKTKKVLTEYVNVYYPEINKTQRILSDNRDSPNQHKMEHDMTEQELNQLLDEVSKIRSNLRTAGALLESVHETTPRLKDTYMYITTAMQAAEKIAKKHFK